MKNTSGYIKQRTDLQEYDSNPSIDLKLLHGFIKEKKRFIKNPYKPDEKLEITQKSGNLSNGLGKNGWLFAERLEVDEETFIKFYADGLNALLELQSQGLKIFRLVYKEVLLNHQEDTITLYFDDLVNKGKWKYSRAVYFSGLSQLLNKSVIFKSTVPHQYFINIQYFYNGNRIVQAREIALKQPNILDKIT